MSINTFKYYSFKVIIVTFLGKICSQITQKAPKLYLTRPVAQFFYAEPKHLKM